MSLSKVFLLVLPFILLSCAVRSHRPEEPVTKIENGSSQVKVKLHKDEVAQVGSSIEAYAQDCHRSTNAKGLTRKICQPRLIGDGKVMQVLTNNTYLVEFDSTVPVTETTEFEIRTK